VTKSLQTLYSINDSKNKDKAKSSIKKNNIKKNREMSRINLINTKITTIDNKEGKKKNSTKQITKMMIFFFMSYSDSRFL